MKRFFSPKVAAIALAVLAAGLAIGAYCVYLVNEESRISIRGFLLAGVLVIGGVGVFVTQAFPTGCATCKRAFGETGAAFAAGMFDYIANALQQGNPAMIAQLANAPPSDASGRSVKLLVRYCEGCRRIGEAIVSEEQWNGQFSQTMRVSPTFPIPEAGMQIVLPMIEQRARVFPVPNQG